MKNVLFLTDFSECSIEAIHYVCSFFSEKNTNYYILHVSKASTITLSKLAGTGSVYDSVLGDDKENLKELKRGLENQYNQSFKVSIRYNNFIKAVDDYISQYNINIVVSGFDGANSLQEKVLGSNTLKLIRSIKTDTLIIPKSTPKRKPKNILCLLDELDDLKRLLKLRELKQSILNIVRVVNNDNYTIANNDKALLQEFKEGTYLYRLITNIPLHYVASFFKQIEHVDLAILLVQKTTVLERLFTNDSTAKINKELIKPILIKHQ